MTKKNIEIQPGFKPGLSEFHSDAVTNCATGALALEQRIDGIYPQTLSDPQAGSLLLYDFVATSELGNSRNRTYSFSTVTFGLL